MSWFQPSQVLVPIDFSAASFEALMQAREVVQQASQIHLVHVLLPLHPADPGVVWGMVDFQSRRTHIQEALGKELKKLDLEGVQLHIVEGDPGQEIARIAEDLEVDLVVLSSHGRTGLPRFMIGSVAERVVRLCHSPVLVIRH